MAISSAFLLFYCARLLLWELNALSNAQNLLLACTDHAEWDSSIDNMVNTYYTKKQVLEDSKKVCSASMKCSSHEK